MLNTFRKYFWVIAVLDICSIDQLELAGSSGPNDWPDVRVVQRAKIRWIWLDQEV